MKKKEISVKTFILHKLIKLSGISKLALQRIKHRKKAGDVKTVAFMCQYIPAWNKLKSIYSAMLKDERYNPLLICVPSDISKEYSFENNDTYKYYVDNGYENVINALDENNNWVSMEDLGVDYAFYCRPYNHLMPEPYYSANVSKYAKICVTFYGYLLFEGLAEILFHRDFFPYVSIYLAESEYTKDYFIKQNKLGYKLRLQKVYFEGVPGLEALFDELEKETPSWDFSKNDFRIMWTPRWTTDKETGGSSFLPFYQQFLSFAEINKDVDVLIRPHPLMFDNFARTGVMTIDEINRFKSECEKKQNVELDKEKEYLSTFWKSDVLISDLSGIMPEYLAVGKPMIYIDLDNVNIFIPETQAMIEACYIVHNFDELEKAIVNLKNGNDYLKDKRKHVAETYFKLEQSKTLGKKIVEILDDN